MFMDFLRAHRRGLTHDDLTDKLKELALAVMEEGRPGSMTITIALKPRAKGEGIDASVAINSKPPKEEPGSSIFFITPSGELVRDDPRQTDMELREIGPASAHLGVA